MGERLLCKQEVVGSNPITSTKLAAVTEFPVAARHGRRRPALFGIVNRVLQNHGQATGLPWRAALLV